MGFSQRKEIGYRNKTEFDQKRIMIASDTKVSLLGYTKDSNNHFEIATYKLRCKDSLITFATFVDDFNPMLIFLVTYSRKKNKSSFKLVQLV